MVSRFSRDIPALSGRPSSTSLRASAHCSSETSIYQELTPPAPLPSAQKAYNALTGTGPRKFKFRSYRELMVGVSVW